MERSEIRGHRSGVSLHSTWATIEMHYLRLSTCRKGGNPCTKILIPPHSGGLIFSAPCSTSLRHLEWRCDKEQGRCADNARRAVKLTRVRASLTDGAPGGAAGLASRRAPSQGAQATRSQGRPKGASQAPGASRRSIPLWGKGKREAAYPGPDKEYGRWRALASSLP